MTRMEGMWNASRAKLSTHASMMVSSDGPLALERTVFSKSREDFDFDEDLQDREFVADFDFDNQIRIKSFIIDVTLRSSSLGHSPVRARLDVAIRARFRMPASRNARCGSAFNRHHRARPTDEAGHAGAT